jgi:hypothetical protein
MPLTMIVSTIANTTQQHAFEYVSDLSHHPDWAMDQMTIEAVVPGPVRVGSKFKHAGTEPFLGGRLHHMNVTVTNLEPSARFAFDTEDGQVEIHHEFRLNKEADRIRIERQLTWTKRPWAHYIIFPMVRGSVYKRLEGAQARLKEKLESSETR